MYKYFLKRVFDFTIALIAIILLSPTFIALTIWLHFANKGSGVFFVQERPGKNGKCFMMLKFKTMTDECDLKGNLLPDEQRLTVIGDYIRSLSIDELPQLINIIKGDMAIVGPRPLLTEYMPLYSKEQARRHSIRPGITGWAQCNGRNSLSWEKRFQLDLWYIDHCSITLDIKIIIMTINKVFKHEGIHSDSSVTMEHFKGNN